VLKFWRNPEFVRHVRAELRPARAIMVAVVALFMCALIGLACWSQRQELLESAEQSAQQSGGRWAEYVEQLHRDNTRETWLLLFRWLMGLQAGVITFWSMFMCAQSVSGERDSKTWDFQRTTSLTSGEITIGKLLGEPGSRLFRSRVRAADHLLGGAGRRNFLPSPTVSVHKRDRIGAVSRSVRTLAFHSARDAQPRHRPGRRPGPLRICSGRLRTRHVLVPRLGRL